MENIREELKKALQTHYSTDGSVENIMKIVKKHMVEKLTQASELADKRSDGYSRFSRNIMSMMAEIKKI